MEKAGIGITGGAKVVGMMSRQQLGRYFEKGNLRLLKAFEIGFRVSVRKKGMSSCELSKEFSCSSEVPACGKQKYRKR